MFAKPGTTLPRRPSRPHRFSVIRNTVLDSLSPSCSRNERGRPNRDKRGDTIDVLEECARTGMGWDVGAKTGYDWDVTWGLNVVDNRET
jgi:hypothetical protein